MLEKQRQKIIFYAVGFLFLANCLAWLAVGEISKPPLWEVIFFDVGQGDSALIKTDQGQQILIDGGPNDIVLEKLGREMPFWDRTLDLVILTHPESDHLSGLIEVLKKYKVSFVLWSGVERETSLFEEWQKALASEKKQDGAIIKIAQAGQKITTGNGRLTTKIEILNPPANMAGQKLKDSNNSSVVCRLVFGRDSFLFTGDISQAIEQDLLSSEADFLAANVLKVSHHGSKYSSSDGFLAAVSPKTAVISAGRDNRYGHPHPDVLARLAKFAITVLRTDQKGDIKFKINPN